MKKVVISATVYFVILCNFGTAVKAGVVMSDDQFTKKGYYGSSVEVNICGDDTDDEISNKHCTCKDDVISCDFSAFPNEAKPVHMHLVSAWETDLVKRICICGAPTNLETLFSNKFLRDHHSVHRVDIYNMSGPIVIAAAFDVNFSGDLYMSNVKYLREIMSWGFGQGVLMKLADTEELCCSKISTPKFLSPVFFVENSTIGAVRSSGINSQHMWKSIVFNHVVFNEMEEYAVSLEVENDLSPNPNVSFTNCDFNTLDEKSISLQGFQNFVIAHSKFHDTNHRNWIDARSTTVASTIVFIGNSFGNNGTSFELHGKNILIWYNKFKIWDQQIFLSLGNKDENVSVEFNSVESLHQDPNDSRVTLGIGTVTFRENVISYCNCSLNMWQALLNSTNRCQVHNSRRHCLRTLKDVQIECSREEMSDVAKICDKLSSPPEVKVKIPALSGFSDEMLNFYAHMAFERPQLDFGEDRKDASLLDEENMETLGKENWNLFKRIISNSLQIVAYYLS